MRAHTRVRAWRRIVVVGTLASLVGIACSSSKKGGTSSGTTAPGGGGATTQPSDVDPAGVLKIGLDLRPGQPSLVYDPIKMLTPAYQWQLAVYDTLLRAQTDGTLTPGLAKSATVVDPQTITVELNPGIKFSDGTPLDADAVKFSIERNVASKNAAAFGAELQQVDTITVSSPTSLTIKLKTPVAGVFYTFLARGETAVVSPTAVKSGVDLSTHPVGAGPFMLQSVVPEVMVRMVKNPTYFQASQVKLAGIDYINVLMESQATAMKSGAVDAIDNLQIVTANQIPGAGLTVKTVQSDSVQVWSPLCKKDPPLSDVRVRQALNYGIDRDAINNVVYGGKSAPLWGLFGANNPLNDPTLKDVYKYDVTKAKQLLADAGYPNGFKLTFLTTAGDSQKVSEIVQQQWKQIGVDLTLQPSSNIVSDFFTPGKPPLKPGYFFPLQRAGLDKITRSFLLGGSGDVCDWNDPDLNALVAKVRAVSPSSPEAKADWAQIQENVFQKALNVFVVFGEASNAYDDKVGNPSYTLNFQGLPFLDVLRVYKKK